jgi:hypothetical protein
VFFRVSVEICREREGQDNEKASFTHTLNYIRNNVCLIVDCCDSRGTCTVKTIFSSRFSRVISFFQFARMRFERVSARDLGCEFLRWKKY